MKFKSILGGAAVLGLASAAIGQEVIINTTPVATEWVADGMTVYRVDVRVDNTAPEAALVTAVQFDFIPDSYFSIMTITHVESGEYPSDDFFLTAGVSTNFDSLLPIAGGYQVVRAAQSPVVSNEGAVFSAWLTVQTDAPLGEASIAIDDVFVVDEQALGACGAQSCPVYLLPFTIVPPTCAGDLDGDNDTDVFDFNIFAFAFGTSGHDPFTGGDLDGDGDVDVFDFNIFAPDFGCGS